MAKIRIDQHLIKQGLASSRKQAEDLINFGKVKVNNITANKSSQIVSGKAVVALTSGIKYVSRAGFKLESVIDKLEIGFKDSSVLDVGSSTGGFSQCALSHGARKIIAIDKGTNQLHTTLRNHPQIELHEQTDIRNVITLSTKVDFVLIDVSFMSIREVLSHIKKIISKDCLVIAMVKPQFETKENTKKHKGIIKNQSVRRDILKSFEVWVKQDYKILGKADSKVHGYGGNIERFYKLKLL